MVECDGGVNGNVIVEFKGGVNGKTIIGCEGGVNGKNGFEHEGGVNGKTIAGCDGGVNGNDMTVGADVVETLIEFERKLFLDWEVLIDFLIASLSSLFILRSPTRYTGGIKPLILPPNLSWPDCLLPPKPPPKQNYKIHFNNYY